VQDRLWIRAPLTLEPGVRVAFRTDVQVNVGKDGSLTAVGTADEPVVFTNAASDEGNWKESRIETASAANRFDHVVFENGGSRRWTDASDSTAMVYLDGKSRATFTNSTFHGSDHYALWVPENGDIEGFSGNTFSGNARAMIVHPNRARAIAGDNTFTDNTEIRVRVAFGDSGRVSDAQTWVDFGTPFYVTGGTFVTAP